MKFSYNWLQDYIAERMPNPKELSDLFFKHSFEVNSVEKFDEDFIFDIDISSNRAFDCFSNIGMAKEIASFCGLTVKIPIFNFIAKEKDATKRLVDIKVNDQSLCLRYVGLVMDKVNIGVTPEKIQKRLKTCGIQSINNVVDILNYVMLETGQPLHSFDLDKIETLSKIKKIIIRKAKEEEKIQTLDGKIYRLDNDILVIADNKKLLAIAGIKGGKKAEIDFNTKTIIIEAAIFNPLSIRKASQLLKLRTDASWRFENGVNINSAEYAIKRASCLIQEIAGGEIINYLDVGPQRLSSKIVELELDYLNDLLSKDFSDQEVKKIIKNLFFEFDDKGRIIKTKVEFKNNRFTIEIPCYRQDISIPEDLIEEIGRVSGYEKIKKEKPLASLSVSLEDEMILKENLLKELLRETGFNEVYNYSFISQEDISSSDNCILIQNPISKKYNTLRPNLLFNFKNNIEQNLKYFSEIKIFEIGNVFKRENNSVIETKNIALCLVKQIKEIELRDELKGTIESLFKKFHINIDNIEYVNLKDKDKGILNQHPFFQLNRVVALKIDDDILGYFGVTCFANYYSVAYFEFNFEKLIKLSSLDFKHKSISPYPAVIRDLSIIVPFDLQYHEIEKAIKSLKENLIKEIRLKKAFILGIDPRQKVGLWQEYFPYRGNINSEGKIVSRQNVDGKYYFTEIDTSQGKNLLLETTYQSSEKNLFSIEVEKIQEKIIKELKKRNWKIEIGK